MKLEIDSNRVIAAAEKCSTAKDVLQTLFPEAFKEKEPEIDLTKLKTSRGDDRLIFTDESAKSAGLQNSFAFQVRGYGEYKNKAFFLCDTYLNWELRRDSLAQLCLIPTRKD